MIPEERLRKGRSGLVGQDWVLEEFEGLFNLPGEEGQPLESVQTRRLRATCDKISVYRHYAYVRERGVSGVPQLSLLSPGTLTVTDTHVDSSDLRIYVTEVTFPEPIRYGETVEFTMVKRVGAQLDRVIQEKGWDWYGLVTLASPAKKARIGIRFPHGKLPRDVWRYEDIISGLVRPGNPNEENRLAIDSSGFTSCSWTDLSAGYSYGISLKW